MTDHEGSESRDDETAMHDADDGPAGIEVGEDRVEAGAPARVDPEPSGHDIGSDDGDDDSDDEEDSSDDTDDAGSTDGPAVDRGRVQRLDMAEADRLEVTGGSVGRATAGSIAVSRGAIGGAQADEVNMTLGAIGGARARYVSVDRGMLGGAVAGEFSVHQGFVQGVLARDVHLEQAGARMVVANTVTFGPQSGALVVFARSVQGTGRILVDWRAGLAMGAALGVVLALLRGRRR